jgi:hypothetical protein
MTTEAVIECVKEYPVLYDMTRPDYKKKGKIWDEIREKLGVMTIIPTHLRIARTCLQE